MKSANGFAAPPSYISRRSPLICANGAIATSQPLASEIGLRILKAGGNAADACVAAVAALNCTEPCMCGIGGDAFCLFYDASTQKVHALNGSGGAPAALTLELARQTGGRGGGPVAAEYEMFDPGCAHAVTVPGAAALWADASRLFGRKPLSEALQPAIDLAEGGFPVNTIASSLWHRNGYQLTSRWGGLSKNPGAAALLRPDGEPPKPGEWMVMRDLAATFRELAAHGADGFYRGRVARAIVAALQSKGSVMSEDDLAAHRTSVEVPISAPFAGHTVHQLPPNGSGLVSLLALRILDALPPPAKFDHGASEEPTELEAARMHRIIESLRLAFADGAEHVGDYAHPSGGAGGDGLTPSGGTPSGAAAAAVIERLLSDSYTASRAALVRDGMAMDDAAAGDVAAGLAASTSETVYLTAVDGDGNACSFICSNYCGFGSGIVPNGCGFTLHNRGANFRLGGPPSHPNLLAPGKRPYHTIIPSMVTDSEGRLVATFGVMGGFMQPQGHVQVLSHVLLRGLDPQRALDAPRLCIEPTGEGESETPAMMQQPRARKRSGVAVHIEEGVPEATLKRLREWGHEVVGHVSGAQRSMHGRGQMIVVVREPVEENEADAHREDGAASPRKRTRRHAPVRRILWAGSDGRGDGCAMGW